MSKSVGVSLPVGAPLLALALLSGCGSGSGHHSDAARTAAAGTSTTISQANAPAPAVRLAGPIRLRSSAFRAGAIRPDYTCDGADAPMPLRWSGVPAGTRELVLVMRDPDASGGGFVHWALAGIPPTATGLESGRFPAGTVVGRNSFGSLGYRGPCPPHGDRPHHYVLTLSALRAPSGLRPGFSADELRTGAIALGTVIATYARR